MIDGPAHYAGIGGQQSFPNSQSQAVAAPRPSRLDAIHGQHDKNIQSLVGLIDKLRAIRARFIGEVPEAGEKNQARALKIGHVGKLEDQAEGIGYGLNQCHEIVLDLLNL